MRKHLGLNTFFLEYDCYIKDFLVVDDKLANRFPETLSEEQMGGITALKNCYHEKTL
jgi:hypothetical protein